MKAGVIHSARRCQSRKGCAAADARSSTVEAQGRMSAVSASAIKDPEV